MFGLFKSRATRLCEKWIRFNAELVRERLRDIWAVERAHGDTASAKRLEDRIFSEWFAGYLVGFADVLVSEFGADEQERGKYSHLFFDAAMSERGGDWVRAQIVHYTDCQSPEFAAAFVAGREDARDCIVATNTSLSRLGKRLLCGDALAA